jgi:hypothetical protein
MYDINLTLPGFCLSVDVKFLVACGLLYLFVWAMYNLYMSLRYGT